VIPVKVKGKYYQKISETIISDTKWNKKHWKTIIFNYSKARYFHDYREIFEALYQNLNDTYLSQINYCFITGICKLLGIKTKISWSMDFNLVEEKTERLVDLCKQTNATEYISGPAAKAYMDEELFKKEKIKLTYMDYSGYPEYQQIHPPFDHYVSILDLIFNEGPNASKYMRSF